MSNAKAYFDKAPALESRSLHDVCTNFSDGFCQLAEGCPWRQTHVITLIDDSTPAKQNLITDRNVLLLKPRKSTTNSDFDNDGPGVLSLTQTPRHDNDHVSIQDIQILPTTDEILALRRPYMPIKSSDQSIPHHLPPGPARLVDISFRHQRYENTEQIIDACYHAMQQLLISKTLPSMIDYQFGLETPNSNRYSLFRNVAFQELSFHESKGAIVRLSFDCPKALQERRIHKAGVLERGMLCALIGLHEETDELTTTFFQVELKEATDAMKSTTGNHTRAAVQLTFADPEDIASVRRSAYYMSGLVKATFVLVDLPTVLLTGFWYHLKRLQKLADNPNFVFASQLAPASPLDSKEIVRPAYASKQGFEYKLSGIQSQQQTGSTFTMRPMDPETTVEESQATLESLKSNTTLDQGQAVALYESLSRELAMSQGPPGTGKSFLGVSLTRVIMDSQDKDDPKPLLVASQTNRACDDFLKDVLEKGMSIVRLGGGSKEEWVAQYGLHALSNKTKMTNGERAIVSQAWKPLEHLSRDGLGWAESLSTQMLGWHSLKDHIKTYHREIYDHFAKLEALGQHETSDIRRIKRYSGFAYEFWVDGGDIDDINALLEVLDKLLGEGQSDQDSSSSAIAQLKEKVKASVKRNSETISTAAGRSSSNVWSLTLSERHALVASWIQALNPWKVCDGFAEIHRRHQAAFNRKKSAIKPYLARCINQKQVIGLTTTGLVQHWDVLEELRLRTVIVEEAPECLESHILSALFPSVQHAIFIGDPLQLRPLINTPALSAEYSPKYRLDESAFERMMLQGFPVSRLTVQRRMHPDIADLSRAGDYDYLIDHESTLSHPPIAGLIDRMYWFNHRQPEDRPDPRSPMAKSHTNRFEVEFCSALVRYLIEHNGYKLGDIVIITPYNGQLAALTTRLSDTCTVRLTDEDRNALLDQGLLQEYNINPATSEGSLTLSDMLRIASVDSFQGMEAPVVIFSAVRSNDFGKLGFLSTRNRVNVATSRARDGFYVLGNADLLTKSEHWAKRIDVFKEKNLIGNSFRASCPRHPEKIYEIHEPEQFSQLPTCSIPCSETLPCGHGCTEKCHPLEMHHDGRITCSAPCLKIHKCGHQCTRKCGERCGECDLQMPAMRLPCGHLHAPSCSETIPGQMFICRAKKATVVLSCGHSKDVICSKANQAEFCDQECGAVLPCGHPCIEACEVCQDQKVHPQCKNLCGKKLRCSHACNAFCHPEECPPCNQRCLKRCQHGGCELQCSKICDPCTLPCGRGGCDHSEPCSMVCSLPCDRLPCGEPCTKLLLCGVHVCPGLCSEACLRDCIECKNGSFPDEHQIYLSCGHTFTVKALDEALNLKGLYQVDENGTIEAGHVSKIPALEGLQCPECCRGICGVERYALASQLPDMIPTIDRYYAKMGRKLAAAVDELFRTGESLRNSSEKFSQQLRSGPIHGMKNQRIVFDRGNMMLELQQRVIRFRNEIVVPFEDNIQRLVKFVNNPDILAKIVPAFGFRYRLVYYLCRLVTLEDALKVFQHLQTLGELDRHTATIMEGLKAKIFDHSLAEVKSLEATIAGSKAANLPRVEAELRIVQLGLHLILRGIAVDSGVHVKASSEEILQLCTRFPETAGKMVGPFKELEYRLRRGKLEGSLLTVYGKGSKDLIIKLGHHKVGSLTSCRYHHTFSAASFEGCPECGKEVAVVAPEVFGEEKLLATAEAFMAKAETLLVSGRFAAGLERYRTK